MRLKRIVRVLSVLLISVTIMSCTAITREIQRIGNASNHEYPSAKQILPGLEKPPYVDLSAYKSVHLRPHQHRDIAIAFAASGGGYRAANLTLGVLLGLEKMHSTKLKSNLLEEVDYYSTVSGSGFGVGYYFTQLHNHFNYYGNSSKTPPFSLEKSVNRMLLNDPKITNPLRVDLTEYLFFGEQRGFALERLVNHELLRTSEGDLSLGDIFIPKNSPEKVLLPYWVTNATIFQNAALFPFTPDVLARFRVTGYFHDSELYRISPEDKITDFAYSVPVSVGVTASASVPFATPATTLMSNGCKGRCYLQLLDGGLSDNSGVYTALSLLLQDNSKIKILIIADATRGMTEPFSSEMLPPANSALFWRVLTVSPDANRERIKPNINSLARNFLCKKGTTNVIVIYLDLSHYPEAQQIGTELSISPENQRLLLDIGQALVTKNHTIKKLIKEINEGKLELGQCGKIDAG